MQASTQAHTYTHTHARTHAQTRNLQYTTHILHAKEPLPVKSHSTSDGAILTLSVPEIFLFPRKQLQRHLTKQTE